MIRILATFFALGLLLTALLACVPFAESCSQVEPTKERTVPVSKPDRPTIVESVIESPGDQLFAGEGKREVFSVLRRTVAPLYLTSLDFACSERFSVCSVGGGRVDRRKVLRI